MTTTDAQLRVFAYVNAEKTSLYRSIMSTFMKAKQQFCLHMRSQELESLLISVERVFPQSASDIAPALVQLCDWGNLEAHPDTADVATVEDFYRPRYLYQLTVEGEAAERALALFDEILRQPGELQTAALTDIRNLLAELDLHARATPLDEAKIHLVLKTLCSRFDELTSKAQLFMASLQRTIDLHGLSVEAFLAYKNTLIDYIERFIGQLVIVSSDIADALQHIAHHEIARLIESAARHELVDRVSASEADLLDARRAWERKWDGLCAWFIQLPGRQSQAEILRGRARSSIPALLSTAAALNERRAARSDRVTDLRTLARWFAQTESDRDRHCLARAAFALGPSRHLAIDEATLADREESPVPANTSWLNAPSVRISLRLRRTGRYRRKGRLNTVIDRKREKALLSRLAAEEAAQIDAARRHLSKAGRIRLSDLGKLDALEFGLFLDLLGAALSRKVRKDETVRATSADGTLEIIMEPTGGDARATIVTSLGIFSGPDHFTTILSTHVTEAVSSADHFRGGAETPAQEATP